MINQVLIWQNILSYNAHAYIISIYVLRTCFMHEKQEFSVFCFISIKPVPVENIKEKMHSIFIWSDHVIYCGVVYNSCSDDMLNNIGIINSSLAMCSINFVTLQHSKQIISEIWACRVVFIIWIKYVMLEMLLFS